MRLGIEASNLRAGGGVTHLVALLSHAQPWQHGFDEVVVWGSSATLERLENRPWMKKVAEPLLDKSLPWRLYWQRYALAGAARDKEIDLLFTPGGSYGGTFRPFVTMFRNSLPFETREAQRFGLSSVRLRLALLKRHQVRTFARADGVIFLTEYARDLIRREGARLQGSIAVIPHGVDHRFSLSPREQRAISTYSVQHPFCILYVSIIDMYKHQWCVAKAVHQLKEEGFPVELDLVGPAYPPTMRLLQRLLRTVDPTGSFIHYRGQVPYCDLPGYYHRADLFVFASSCENMPNTLLEAMAAGLPIACSRCGPMEQVAGPSAVYFDPEKPANIAEALRQLISDPALRATKAKRAFERAGFYSWERCARETFCFLAGIANTGSSVDSLRI